MALLQVFRDGTFERELHLDRADLRIGRAEDNDLVLPDLQKGVSRYHAEIQPEGDGFVIVDLQSQNGLWLEDRRISRERLQPGVPVSLGPYRLVLATDEATHAAGDDYGTIAVFPDDPSAIEPPRVAPPPPGPPLPPPPLPPARDPRRASGFHLSPAALVTAAVVAGVAMVLLVSLLSGTDGDGGTTTTTTTLAPSTTLVRNPALTPEEQARVPLADATALVDQKRYDEARVRIADVQRIHPESAGARALLQRIESESVPSIGASTTLPEAAWPRGLPEIPPRRGESQALRIRRARLLSAEFEAARDLRSKGSVDAALSKFEEIYRAEPDFPGIREELDAAREQRDAAMKENAAQRVRTAQGLEQAGELRKALAAWQEVHTSGANQALATQAMQRVRARMIDEGLKALKDGDNAVFANNLGDAARHFERAIDLLEGHPKRAEAQEKLRDIKKPDAAGGNR